MRASKLFIASGVLLLLGLAFLWSKWNGSAGIGAGDSLAAWSVNFSGSVQGWPALLGILAIVAAILVFVSAVVKAALRDSRS